MAQAKKTKKNQPSTKVAQNLSPLIKEGVMYMLIVLAVYFFICLISFSANDPGWTHTLSSDGISNWGGLMGAFLSDMLLHVFGKMAFIFPILFAVAAFKIYQFRWDEAPRLAPKLLTFAGFLLVIIGGCGLENIHDHGYLDIESWVPGGVLGYAIVSGAGPTFGFIGTTLFLLALLVLGMSWFTGLSWFTVMDYLGKKIYNSYVYVAGKIQEFLDKRAGIKARADREEKVRTIQKKTSSQEPPKIEQRAQTAEPSIRALKEKQQTLFTKQPTQKVKSVAKSKHVSSGDNTIPPLSLLDDAPTQKVGYSTEYLQKLSQLLEKKLLDFNIEARVVGVIPGPVITRFEIDPAPGVKASQITNLSTDLARAMSVISVRVIENIPGKAMVGIEIPNEERETVYMIEGVSSEEYDKNDSPLTILLGKDIAGEAVIADLAKMPHVLIAGTTGSGKSVCVNALIISMLYKSTPEQLRLIMIDPKMLELSIYEGIPHLLAPVVTDMEKAANALRWAIYEMERRYRIMSAMGVRNLSGYNRKIELAIEAGEPLRDPLAENPEEAEELSTLPFIVIVIDELADLMMVIGKKIEELITRIAQKARAAGIHMILATQRPSVDVITGLIKANIPTRIAFQVSSRVDSRTVLDQMGAEQLLGHGDMLYLPPGSGMPMRVHGSFVSDSEVHKIVEYIKENSDANYDDSILETSQVAGEKGATSGFDNGGTDDDPLYDEAVSFVCERQVASISSVQRQLRVGYNRAARLIEQMEEQGVIGAPESGGKRQVLAPPPPKD